MNMNNKEEILLRFNKLYMMERSIHTRARAQMKKCKLEVIIKGSNPS